jgi:PIN domain nuclease of toxin-antitoxin system
VLLLDTHCFLWFIWNDPQLSDRAKNAIKTGSPCYVSIVSLWEISIKLALNKVSLPAPYASYIPEQVRLNQFTVMPMKFKHTVRQMSLPMYHRDPFDRLLLAQAIEEGLTVVSGDEQFLQYDVAVLW